MTWIPDRIVNVTTKVRARHFCRSSAPYPPPPNAFFSGVCFPTSSRVDLDTNALIVAGMLLCCADVVLPTAYLTEGGYTLKFNSRPGLHIFHTHVGRARGSGAGRMRLCVYAAVCLCVYSFVMRRTRGASQVKESTSCSYQPGPGVST